MNLIDCRMSSNPHLWSVVVSSFGPSRKCRMDGRSSGRREEGESNIPLRDEKGEANKEGGDYDEKDDDPDDRRKDGKKRTEGIK